MDLFCMLGFHRLLQSFVDSSSSWLTAFTFALRVPSLFPYSTAYLTPFSCLNFVNEPPLFRHFQKSASFEMWSKQEIRIICLRSVIPNLYAATPWSLQGRREIFQYVTFEFTYVEEENLIELFCDNIMKTKIWQHGIYWRIFDISKIISIDNAQ